MTAVHILLKTESGDRMLVTLSILEGTGTGILPLLKRDELRQEKVTDGEISLTKLYYTRFHKKINTKKIAAACKNLTDTVICPPEVFPEHGEMQRFSDYSLDLRLMENFILDLLKDFPPNTFRMILCDPLGEFHEFAEKLSMHTTLLTIITKMSHFYTNCVSEWTVPGKDNLRITEPTEEPLECDLLIHPKKITAPLSIKSRCSFTAYPPEIDSKEIVHHYLPIYPSDYEKLLPENIDRDDFFRALYAVERKYELGRLIPEQCICGKDVFTKKQIIERFTSKKELYDGGNH